MAQAKNTTGQVPEQKFPSEIIDLPSGGKLYDTNSPIRSGKIEIKYMTAREEDILTSANLIKKGVVIDRLLNALILTPGINTDDLFLGDKNAVMVAARILAYGAEYTCEITDPQTEQKVSQTFNLADCPFKELPSEVDYKENRFEFELPTSKDKIVFQLLTGKNERAIENEMQSKKKLGSGIDSELTTRLRHVIVSVNDDSDRGIINSYVMDRMLARDSLALRNEIQRVSPDIDLTQEVEVGGEVVEVAIPMTTEFFWPQS
tara:strand:+ start:2628 stop:3410 length:783 start_codon:yes stop_codon:yes gene_type:complete